MNRAGGVLAKKAIEELACSPGGLTPPLISRISRDADNGVVGLRAAAYDLRVGGHAQIYRGDEVIDCDLTEMDGVVLEPGDTAAFESHEALHLPSWLAGTVSLKTSWAQRGLLLLSGLLIDPGFEGELQLYVANVGSSAIVITPRRTSIAAVQFLCVQDAPETTDPVRRGVPDDGKSLGFLAELKELRQEHEGLKHDVDRNTSLTDNVLMLGYFVLSAAILGITLDQILQLGGNPATVDRVNKAIPDSVDGKLLLGFLVFALAWTISSLRWLLPHARTAAPTSTKSDDVLRLEALRKLKLARARRGVALGVLGAAVGTGLVWTLAQLDASFQYWLIPTILAIYVYLGLLAYDKSTPAITKAKLAKTVSELAGPPCDEEQRRCLPPR